MGYAFFESVFWAFDVYYYSKKQNDEALMKKNLIIWAAYIMNATIAVLMTMFLRFHLKLAFSNKTTIENLEMKNKTY